VEKIFFTVEKIFVGVEEKSIDLESVVVKEGGSVIRAQKFFVAPIANTYIATKTGWKLALTVRMQ